MAYKKKYKYKGGSYSSKAGRDFQDEEYKAFRKHVRRRDKKCKFPGCSNRKYCEVHHIIPWAAAPYLRYEKNNGILLCKEHHVQVTNFEYLYIDLFNKIVEQAEKIYAKLPKKRKYKKRIRKKKKDENKDMF